MNLHCRTGYCWLSPLCQALDTFTYSGLLSHERLAKLGVRRGRRRRRRRKRRGKRGRRSGRGEGGRGKEEGGEVVEEEGGGRKEDGGQERKGEGERGNLVQFSSVAQSCPTLCDPMDWSIPGLPPSPSPTPRVYPNSCPLSRWCHPTISSSVVPFSSCLQSLPASGSFQMSQLFTSGGQSTGVSASTSVLPMNTQGWSPLGWTGWISFQPKGLSRVFSNTTVQKHQFFGAQLSSQSNSHIHTWPLEKP